MKHRFYLAGPVVTDDRAVKDQITCIYDRLSRYFGEETIYRPGLHTVPNAWGITMEMWGQCVFTMDVLAIDDAEWIVLCNYGRQGATAGTAWECGYAFAKGKKILVINMPGMTESSLMIRGCAANVIDYADFLHTSNLKDVFIERGKLPANMEKLH